MASNNLRGFFPIISITDGVVEKMGWLEQGGYRIGIRSEAGGYFYYAHLASYAPELNIGDSVIAGQLLGFMGDSGYGSEGTIGQFDVHLHLGIYVNSEASDSGEMSVNPYCILRILEKNRTKYAPYAE
jgi:murein DD-endopeptidase MepM/ murein hydrolase activator NlpD